MEDLSQIPVRKAVFFSLDQEIIRQFLILIFQDLFFQIHQFFHLFQEPHLNMGHVVEFL